MKPILLALSLLGTLGTVSSVAEAQPCCWGYRVRYYRVHPYYQVVRPPPRPPRWSLGVHSSFVSTNQMIADEGVFLGGLGGHLRYRGYRWGVELAADVVGNQFLEGAITRISMPMQASALLYLVPEGRFNLYLVGGFRVQPTHISLDLPNLREEQLFAEFGFHGGVGADIVLSHGFALTGDVRFFGLIRDDNNPAGKYYEGVENGILPDKSAGIQVNLGVSFRF